MLEVKRLSREILKKHVRMDAGRRVWFFLFSHKALVQRCAQPGAEPLPDGGVNKALQ